MIPLLEILDLKDQEGIITKIIDMKILKYINSSAFFHDYLPHIKSYVHKMRGKNGRGNPLDFSEAEKKEIKSALKKLFKDTTG